MHAPEAFRVMGHPDLTIAINPENIHTEHFSVYFLYSWLPEKEAVVRVDAPEKHEKFLSSWKPTTLRTAGKSVLPFLFIYFFTLCTFQFSPKLPSQM